MQYDVFLSCPMAGTKSDARYREVRAEAIRILECLESECQFRVFFAGRALETRSDFDEADFSIAKDIRALEESQYFLLFYPERVVSSVLVEAGMALALKKKAVYFVRERRHLPFMLQKVESIAPVKVCEFKTTDRVLTVIRNYRKDLFEPWVVGYSAQATDCDEVASGGTPPPGGSLYVRLTVLQQAIPDVSEDLRALEQVSGVDVPSSLNKVRYIAEKVLHRLCARGKVGWGEAAPTLERMLGPLVAKGCLPKNMAIHARTIQANTSPGSHYQEAALSASHAVIAQQALLALLEWFATQLAEPAEPGAARDGGRDPSISEFPGTEHGRRC
jgi:hypothetical protein